MDSVRIAFLNIRLALRIKVTLFFTFVFPVIFLFIYAGLFGHGNPQAVLYLFGPVVTLNIMGSGFWGLGIQSVINRERGSLRRYRLAPIGAGTMVTSNLLANYLLGLPAIGLVVLCAIVFFRMPLAISLLTLLVLITVGTFAFAGFGLTIASVANTMQEAQIYNNVCWLTLLFLSGVTVPLPLLPHWIQRLAAFLPATYLVTSFQSVMVQGQPLAEHWAEMVVLLVSGVFGLLFAWKLFRWEKEEKISRGAKLAALVFVVPFALMGFWMNARGDLLASWQASYSLMSQAGRPRSQPTAVLSPRIIDDFDGLEASENLLKRWQVSTPSGAASRSLAELSLIAPGAEGTGHALRLRGVLAPSPGAAQNHITARYIVTVPAGLEDLRGIQFAVRGDSRVYQLRFGPERAPTGPLPGIAFVPSAEWQTVRLPVGWLAASGPSSQSPAPWTLEIAIDGPPGSFQLDLDEIRFY
jgi:ABC-2 type transport system permease protein